MMRALASADGFPSAEGDEAVVDGAADPVVDGVVAAAVAVVLGSAVVVEVTAPGPSLLHAGNSRPHATTVKRTSRPVRSM